jgi:hypothetical protein
MTIYKCVSQKHIKRIYYEKSKKMKTLLSQQARFLPLLSLAVPRNDVLTRTSFGTALNFSIASCEKRRK